MVSCAIYLSGYMFIQVQPVIRNKSFILIVLPYVKSYDIHLSCSKLAVERALSALTIYLVRCCPS